MARPTNEERIKRLEEQNAQVLEALAAEKKAKEEAEAKLTARDEGEKQAQDPMSGPGVLCEAVKVTLAEAWQLRRQEFINPDTRTEEMRSEPVPEGYVSREGPNNTLLVVKPGNEKSSVDLREAAIPNCRSKYTQEYSVKGPKKAQDRGNFDKEPPRFKVHLCEKHREMFGAKTEEQVKEAVKV